VRLRHDSTTAGLVTINASTNGVVAGQSITRSTGDGLSGDSANAVKTYVDAYITITRRRPTTPPARRTCSPRRCS